MQAHLLSLRLAALLKLPTYSPSLLAERPTNKFKWIFGCKSSLPLPAFFPCCLDSLPSLLSLRRFPCFFLNCVCVYARVFPFFPRISRVRYRETLLHFGHFFLSKQGRVGGSVKSQLDIAIAVGFPWYPDIEHRSVAYSRTLSPKSSNRGRNSVQISLEWQSFLGCSLFFSDSIELPCLQLSYCYLQLELFLLTTGVVRQVSRDWKGKAVLRQASAWNRFWRDFLEVWGVPTQTS